MSVANGMIAFPNQCGTIRLFEAKTLKEYIRKYNIELFILVQYNTSAIRYSFMIF